MSLVPESLSRYLSFIPAPEAYIAHLGTPIPQYVRLNTLKAKESVILDILASDEVKLSPTVIPLFYRLIAPADLGTTRAYQLGLIYPQALSSALPVLALDPRPGELILDVCAAPGGKTTYIAQIIGEEGLVVANDIRFARLTALTANINRLGTTCVVVTFIRGEQYPVCGPFDRILVDAPCSGEGKFRIGDSGEILFQKTGTTNLPAIQKGLIVKSFDLLAPGATLVYSTCTLNPGENEEVVSYLLRKRPAVLVDWEPPLPSHPGILEFEGRTYDAKCNLCRRFYPHETDTVGFFVAKVVKPG